MKEKTDNSLLSSYRGQVEYLPESKKKEWGQVNNAPPACHIFLLI